VVRRHSRAAVRRRARGRPRVDDNPYLHRRFLEISHQDQLWWLANLGAQLSATVFDPDGRFQAWLAPGVRLPLVFQHLGVRFSAGPTTYELALHVDGGAFDVVPVADLQGGSTTLGRVTFTDEQRLLIVALAEPVLRARDTSRVQLPTSAEAAARLGWSLTKFNRKLDNVCQKLEKAGIRGLHGNAGQLAMDRRGRLVEYALAVRLVTIADLASLETN
jgi:hypothetical protein